MDLKEDSVSLKNLQDFKIKRQLNYDPENKFLAIEGTFTWDADKKPGLLLIQNSVLSLETTKSIIESPETSLSMIMDNDIYRQFNTFADPKLNPLIAKLIYPATEKHINKYIHSPYHLIVESGALFNTLTQAYLKDNTFSLDWVYNILNHQKEREHIMYENEDYMILKDYNWNGSSVEDLHILGIVQSRDISSLRDLRLVHVPLLKSIYREGTRVIHQKYDILPSQLRVYLHYQPSFYHLHVHFAPLMNTKGGVHGGKAHLLQDVICNIQNNSYFYEEASLSFGVKESDKLYKYYLDAGYNFGPDSKEVLDHDKLLVFFKHLGQAKHEPCGEHWLMSFGESAWRMALLSMCLPPTLDRVRLCKISLTSAFTCFGSKTDQNSQWSSKLKEVRSELFRLLPFSKAVELYDMYAFHVSARMGQNSDSEMDMAYRGVLEVEEALLQTEELAKEGELSPEEVIKVITNRMAKAKFIGYEKYAKFNDDSEFRSVISFIQKASALTKLKRTGWVRFGVANPETVAGHMFRMGVMSLIFSESTSRDMREGSSVIVSLLHDVAECIVGDITPVDGVSDEDKHDREMKAIRDLSEGLRGDLGCDIYTNFERYEFQKDDEARLTKQIDKLDMIIQAHEYEVLKGEKYLQEFFDSTVGKNIFYLDVTKEHVKHLMKARESAMEGK